jgi:hypothetical protein
MFLTSPVGFWVPFFVDTKMEQRFGSLEKNMLLVALEQLF